MQATVQHPVYGEVTYYENAWSGRKNVYLNSVELAKKNKLTFLFNDSEGTKEVKVVGNMLMGVKLNIDGTLVEMTPSAKWYEFVAALSLFLFVMVWGNSEVLVAIFPIVGGGLGGAISGLMMCFTLMAMKSAKKWYYKLLIWLGMFVANALACFLVALAIISAIA